jgi:carbamoyl-phosphate synthase large subunit
LSGLTVLLSSAGRRVGLLGCFRQSAEDLALPLRILAADMAPDLSAACAEADGAFKVHPCSQPEFIEDLLSLCASEKVDLVVPTIDPELQPLAANAQRFSSLGTTVAVSDPDVVAVARNKFLTAKFFAGIGVPAPRTAPLKALYASLEEWRYPLLLKPNFGSSSIGVVQIDDASQVRRIAAGREEDVVQEYCKGTEYTVNLFFDRSGLRCAVPHRRIEVRAGEVSKARTERVPSLMAMAEKIGGALKGGALGAICFQAIVDANEQPTAIEINARFGGGYPLAHHCGATFTKWLLEMAAGRVCSAHDNWRENVVMLRYDAAVFREHDQTVD